MITWQLGSWEQRCNYCLYCNMLANILEQFGCVMWGTVWNWTNAHIFQKKANPMLRFFFPPKFWSNLSMFSDCNSICFAAKQSAYLVKVLVRCPKLLRWYVLIELYHRPPDALKEYHVFHSIQVANVLSNYEATHGRNWSCKLAGWCSILYPA
jgi:hypothetical protein